MISLTRFCRASKHKLIVGHQLMLGPKRAQQTFDGARDEIKIWPTAANDKRKKGDERDAILLLRACVYCKFSEDPRGTLLQCSQKALSLARHLKIIL